MYLEIMFFNYPPNVKATIVLLRQLKVKVNDATINDTLQNHPEWPSLLSVSDSLYKWNIPNSAGKIDVNKIDELPIPFIAFTKNKENQLAVITSVSDSIVTGYQTDYNKVSNDSKENFLSNWNGIYLIAEPNEHSIELNYQANKRKAFFNAFVPVTALATLLIYSFLLLTTHVNVSANLEAVKILGIYFEYIILIAGVIVTSLLLWYEIDKNNSILQRVCTGIAKGNCNAILSGKQAKVFYWLSWSEMGFFYFTGGLFALLSAANNLAASLSIIAWLNVLVLPYTIFSVYYQWRVAKQWCVLCLAVQALLMLGFINGLFSNFLVTPAPMSLSIMLNFILLYALPAFVWFTVKPFILQLQKAKNTKRELLRMKFNTDIFDSLLKKQKQITIPVNDLGIDFGNPAAANTIIKVCNPFCGPCAKAHEKIEALLEQVSNLKVKIIFTTPDNEEHPAIKPTQHLMAIAETNKDKKAIKQSLDDWYLAEKKDYDLFAAKYPMNGELAKQGNKIIAMEKWSNSMEISFTPTIFLNGYQLPDAYSIEDLQYFLLE